MTPERLVRARKQHVCDEYTDPHPIRPGQDYVRLVAFPDGDVNTSSRPPRPHDLLASAGSGVTS